MVEWLCSERLARNLLMDCGDMVIRNYLEYCVKNCVKSVTKSLMRGKLGKGSQTIV